MHDDHKNAETAPPDKEAAPRTNDFGFRDAEISAYPRLPPLPRGRSAYAN